MTDYAALTRDELVAKLDELERQFKLAQQLDPEHRCTKGDVLLFVLGMGIGTASRIRSALDGFDIRGAMAAADELHDSYLKWADALGVYADRGLPR